MGAKIKKIEFILAIIIGVLLVSSLLSQQYLNLPYQFVSFLILAFVIVKLYDIIKSKGTIFEDYVSLSIIILFGIIHIFLRGKINSIIIAVMVGILVYSVGLIPWIDDLLMSRRITSFIVNYAFFVVIIILLFAGIYSANNENFLYNDIQKSITFEDSLYFSAMTFTTVGYGDIAPLSINKLIASIQAIIGMILNIAFLGYILAFQKFKKK